MNAPIGLYFASTTGNTADVAQLLAERLGHEQVALHDLAADGLAHMESYSQLIMGIPTWDFGELQEDWLELWPELEEMDFSGKQVALFGLGDQIGYGEWFLDAMGLLHDLLQARGATLCGYTSIAGFTFEASKALSSDGQQFVGMAIDEDGQHGETEERVDNWATQLQDEFCLQN
ncbi:MAG: flavodoxin [Marinobacterium sp.]|nr:flavodoxin [Marinobacterium sp.]